MTIDDILTLPKIALLDLTSMWAEEGRYKRRAVHFGAMLSTIKRKKLYRSATIRRFSQYCRHVLHLKPQQSEYGFIQLYHRCVRLGLSQYEMEELEKKAHVRVLCLWTKVAISKEELWEFSTWFVGGEARRKTWHNVGLVRLLGEERGIFQRRQSALGGVRFTKNQSEKLSEILSYFGDHFDLNKAQSIMVMCCLVATMRTAVYGKRTERMRSLLAEYHLPTELAIELCPP